MPDNIKLLQQTIRHGGNQAFSIVPMVLNKVITERQWQERQDRNGNPFNSFEEFMKARLWYGLETTLEDLRAYCRKTPEVWQLVLAEMEPGREELGRPPQNDNADNISITRRHGTSAIYTLKRLKRERPDLFQKVTDGEMSANAAAIAAGFRHKRTPFETIVWLLPRLTDEERMQLHELLR